MKKILFLLGILFVSLGMIYSQSIQVTSPTGKTLYKNGSMTIAWNASGISGNVEIKLKKTGVPGKILFPSHPVGNSPVHYACASLEVGEYYVIIKQGTVKGTSPKFKILSKPEVAVESQKPKFKKIKPAIGHMIYLKQVDLSGEIKSPYLTALKTKVVIKVLVLALETGKIDLNNKPIKVKLTIKKESSQMELTQTKTIIFRKSPASANIVQFEFGNDPSLTPGGLGKMPSYQQKKYTISAIIDPADVYKDKNRSNNTIIKTSHF